MTTTSLTTKCGQIKGLDMGDHHQYLGIKYASSKRFEYAKPVQKWLGCLDATKHGDACIQKRLWYAHLEIPERMFYHREFRQDVDYTYSEDCLNLDIYTPNKAGKFPVLVFIHGGGFDSGCNYDSCITGEIYARKGIVFVSINYRVGIFGYLTHKDIENKYGHDGNFGLDDQLLALKWIKDNIAAFSGDADNITVMGQSAGAISIQYLCLNKKCQGLFNRAIMLSGAGLFPKFSLPRPAANTREYWLDLMNTLKVNSLEELKAMSAHEIFTGLEEVKARRKDNTYNTMPVIDGYLIEKPIDEMISGPLNIPYLIGYTNNDMYAIILGSIAHKYSKANRGYLYYFDINAPGNDSNGAFHSSDLRYVFGSLNQSHRPYRESDYNVSDLLINYIINFCTKGDPNHENAPLWIPGGKSLHLTGDLGKVKMCRPKRIKLLWNTLTKGDPK